MPDSRLGREAETAGCKHTPHRRRVPVPKEPAGGPSLQQTSATFGHASCMRPHCSQCCDEVPRNPLTRSLCQVHMLQPTPADGNELPGSGTLLCEWYRLRFVASQQMLTCGTTPLIN
jgi:hypothetical protein